MTETNNDKALVEYEEVVARNPVTQELITVKIEKPVEKTPEQVADNLKSQLAKFGLEPISKVEITDPLSGEKRIITVDRTGYGEAKLIVALADPNLSRDQKDFYLSMHLFERGKESMSFISDIMRSKGAHTKETRVFKSQVRFDLDMMANLLAQYLEDQVSFSSEILGVDVLQDQNDFYQFVQERRDADKKAAEESGETYVPKKYTYLDYAAYTHPEAFDNLSTRPAATLTAHAVSQAIHSHEVGQQLRKFIRNIADARDRDKGKGIYISRGGKIVDESDPDLDALIAEDRRLRQEAEDDEHNRP